jgi:hypothetical protein
MKKWTDEDISPAQTEYATKLRIPFIKSHPDWNYVTGVIVEKWFDIWEGVVPTEDELDKIAAWRDQYNKYYNQSYLKEMAEAAPYDIDGGANFAYLIKYADGSWGYRKRTWEYPMLWPLPLLHPDHYPKTLEEILDKTRVIWRTADG